MNRRLLALLLAALPLAATAQNNTVFLDDREPHTWSYYSDPASPVRSLNPADVKITYYAYGTNTVYTSPADQPGGGPSVSVSPASVGIGIDAPDKSVIVYHKTLERVNGEQAISKEAADGPCLYRLIPNPFSLRPTYNQVADTRTRWRGFYKWRLRRLTGGSVYRDSLMSMQVNVGTMLDAEDTLFFMPAAEYGMEVAFEVIWARAFVFPDILAFDTAAPGTYATGRNAYERNFVVYTGDSTVVWPGRDSASIGKEVTITAVYPNGTDGTSNTRLTEPPQNMGIDGRYFEYSCRGDVPEGVAPKETVGARRSIVLSLGKGALKFEYIKFTFGAVHKAYLYKVVDTDSVVSGVTQEDLGMSWTFAVDYYRDDTLCPVAYRGDTVYWIYRARPSGFGHPQTRIFLNGARFVAGRMCSPLAGEEWCTEGTDGIFPGGSPTNNGWVNGLVGLNNNNTGEQNSRWRLESGNYYYIMFLGFGVAADRVQSDITLGSDYDRSLGDNSRLKILNIRGGQGMEFNNEVNKGKICYHFEVKSGFFNRRNVGNSLGGVETLYLGSTDNGDLNYQGARSIVVWGGEFGGLSGGCDPSRNQHEYVDSNFLSVRMRIHGGRFRGSVYGAAEHAVATGSRRMVFTGGEVNGWLAGGSNGTLVNRNGAMAGSSFIYFGGNARLQHSHEDPKIAASYGGNLFGAGSGHSEVIGDDATVGVVHSSTIVIADSCFVSRNVFGGGNHGRCIARGSDIHILGGKIQGRCFGGSNRQTGKQVNIVMRGGQVCGGVFGGSNLLGRVEGPVFVNIEGGTVGEPGCADSLGNVFGCGYGEATSIGGDVQVVIGREDAKHPHANNPLVHGHVYGGGFNAPHNSIGKTFSVTTWNGLVDKHVFGGGYGTSAVITGDTRVNILGTTHVGGNVYGGGNLGRVKGNTKVQIGD